MKFGVFTLAGSACLIIISALYAETVRLSGEVASQKILYEASRVQTEVLRDQLADLQFEQSSNQTYAEGVRDGYENSKNIDYRRGYDTAAEQFAAPSGATVTSNEQ